MDATDEQLSAAGVTRPEFDRLSEAEREILLERDEDTDTPVDTDNETIVDETLPDDEVDPAPAPADAAPPEAAPTDAAPAASADKPNADPIERDPFVYVPKGESLEAIAAERATVDAERAALMQKFEDGDLTVSEYERERAGLDAKVATLVKREAKAEFAAESATEAMQQRWAFAQEAFMEEPRNTELYQTGAIARQAYALLDLSVRDLGSDPANAARSTAWFLREADKRVRELLKIDVPAAPPVAAPTPPKSRQPDLSKVPATLSNIPAAAREQPSGDEFAYLDNLDGLELEHAVARMSREQRARYEAMT